MEEEWTVDANEAVNISLVTPTETGLKKIETFNPKFTYAIFGEEERIFGYKGLKVNLSYSASDLRPNLSVSSIRKFKSVGDVEAFDVVGTLKEFLPAVAFQKKEDYELALKNSPGNWTPPGELVKTIERGGDTYEIWRGNLADDAVKQLVKRIQICVLFYIEGGSYIGEDADGKEEPEYSLARWSVYFLYKKQVLPENVQQYVFHGYSTVYNFWLYELPTPPSTPGKEPIQPKTDDSWELPPGDLPYGSFPHRARISQFVILPPFQGKGIGAMLYNTIFELQSKDVSTKEITVEDPNEAFDLLRDICDLKYLRKNVPHFANLTVNPVVTVPQMGGVLHHNLQISLSDGPSDSSANSIVDIAALEELRVSVKIAPRQFARLVEIHLMSKLPDSVQPRSESDSKISTGSKADRNIYTLWRLLLKQRLYRRNATILGEFETTERIIKLNETLDNVEWEYARILERVEGSRPDDTTAELPATNGNSNGKGKRKSDDEVTGIPSSKRARVEDTEDLD